MEDSNVVSEGSLKRELRQLQKVTLKGNFRKYFKMVLEKVTQKNNTGESPVDFEILENHCKFLNLGEPVGPKMGEPIGATNGAPPLDTEYEPFESAEATLVRE